MEDFAALEERREASVAMIDAMDKFVLYYNIEQMLSGDCTPLIEIDEAARSGDAQNQWLLSDLFRNGLCIQQSDSQAMTWVTRAAEQGNIDAQRDLGTYYIQGIGTEVDVAEGINWLRQAGNAGQADAQAYLGNLYETGEIVVQNHSEAVRWYERAFDSGNHEVCANWGFIALEVANTQAEQDEAIEIFRNGAEFGVMRCQASMALVLSDSPISEEMIEAHMWANIALQNSPDNLQSLLIEARESLNNSLTREQLSLAQDLALNWEPTDQNEADIADPAAGTLPAISMDIVDAIDSAEESLRTLEQNQIEVSIASYMNAVAEDNLPVFILFHKAGADLESSRASAPGTTALYVATDHGSDSIFDYLLDNGANIDTYSTFTGQTPLLRAIAHERVSMVNRLIELGADASMRQGFDDELLPPSPLAYALQQNDPELVSTLLNIGSSVEETYFSNDTPLHEAIEWDSPESLYILLATGADANKANELGITPLLAALSKDTPEQINIGVIRALLEAGADTEQSSNFSISPALMATIQGRADIIRELVAAGMNTNIVFNLTEERTPYALTTDLQKSVVQFGGSPLMLATALGNISAMRALIETGASPEHSITISGQSFSIADIAEENGLHDIFQSLTN